MTIHRDLNIMMRCEKISVGINPPGILGPMICRVPTTFGQIESADERNGIVDDNDLGMMRGSDRMIAVHMKVNARVPAPGGTEEWQALAIERKDHREIPYENMDVEMALPRR